MKCPEFHELMSLLDGELTETRAGELRKHLEDCPGCVALLESQDGLERAWRESFHYPPREAFREMEDRIAWNMAARRRRRRRWNVLLPAAAAAAVALLGVRLMLFGDGGLPTGLPPGIDAVNPSVERGFQASEPACTDGDAVGSTFHQRSEALERPGELQEMEEMVQTAAGEFGDRPTEGTGDQVDDMTLQGASSPDGAGPDHTDLSPGSLPEQTDHDGIVPEEMLDGLLAGASGSSLDASGHQMDTQEVLSTSRVQWFAPPEMISLDEGSSSGGSVSNSGFGGSSGGGGMGVMQAPEETVSSELGEEAPSDVVSTGYCYSGLSEGEVQGEEEAAFRSTTISSNTETADVPIIFPGGGDEIGGVEGDTDLTADTSVDPAFSSENCESIEVVTICQADVYNGDGSSGGPTLALSFDRLGIPDPLTVAILDSLFPEWSLYIPFAFRDTVLIVAPGEVRSRLAGDDLPAEAE